MEKKTIAVAGTGYVGLANAVLLSLNNKVYAVDIIKEKVDLINKRKSPIQDKEIEEYLAQKDLKLEATLDAEAAYAAADYILIAAPTNYDSRTNYFDTSHVEEVIDIVLRVNPDAIIIIKSTVPVGYSKSIKEKKGIRNLLFSPEFLREGKALYDDLYPSRIIVGYEETDSALRAKAEEFASLLAEGALKKDIEAYVQDKELREKMDALVKTEKNYGRIETRSAYVTSDIEWLEQGKNWKNLKSIGAIHTEFKSAKGQSSEWHYYISSRDLSAKELLHHARMEWSVETMHWLLDVHFEEDWCLVEDKHVQQHLNMFRKAAINLIKQYKTRSCPKKPISNVMLDCLIDDSMILKVISEN